MKMSSILNWPLRLYAPGDSLCGMASSMRRCVGHVRTNDNLALILARIGPNNDDQRGSRGCRKSKGILR